MASGEVGKPDLDGHADAVRGSHGRDLAAGVAAIGVGRLGEGLVGKSGRVHDAGRVVDYDAGISLRLHLCKVSVAEPNLRRKRRRFQP